MEVCHHVGLVFIQLSEPGHFKWDIIYEIDISISESDMHVIT